jgi:hypothetical protein
MVGLKSLWINFSHVFTYNIPSLLYFATFVFLKVYNFETKLLLLHVQLVRCNAPVLDSNGQAKPGFFFFFFAHLRLSI